MRRGFTLIEMMIAVAVVGICVTGGMKNGFFQYERASRRAQAAEGMVRLLDQEMERLRNCDTRECVDTIAATGTAQTSETWERASLKYAVANGPDGTLAVTVTATAAPTGRRILKREISALIGVSP